MWAPIFQKLRRKGRKECQPSNTLPDRYSFFMITRDTIRVLPKNMASEKKLMPDLMSISRWTRRFVLIVVSGFLISSSLHAATGDPANGKRLFMKKCAWCHGKKGEGDGPGAKFIIPPPRDFSLGVYKFKTSTPDTYITRDEDIFHTIINGLPGTSMPSWKEIFDDQEVWDMVAYLKSLSDMFDDEPNPPPINYSGKIPSSPESIEKGKKAFFDEAKCWECHGREGKGNLMKKLKEDDGARLWPRNFTKPWTFHGGYTPEAIFSRVTNGIPFTPMQPFVKIMPAFGAEKSGSGKLSEEDRWHVVNYVMSLADDRRRVKEGETVVKGVRRKGLPKDENDEAWNEVSGTAFYLVPQFIKMDGFFIPSNDLVIVKAVFTDKEIAFQLELDDRTKSVPGDKRAEALAWDVLSPDAIAIQTPVKIPDSADKHGDSLNRVSVLYWNSGSVEKPDNKMMFTATGSQFREESDMAAAGFEVSASYHEGTWKVMMKRNLTTPNKDMDTQFKARGYIPIAFANWDGSNTERGSKHTMTAWRWLLLLHD